MAETQKSAPPNDSVQAGTDIPAPQTGKVADWLFNKSDFLRMVVHAAVAYLNLIVYVVQNNQDGTSTVSAAIRPVITSKSSVLKIPVDLTSVATSGLRFQTPNIELDPTVSVSANVIVYLSPGNPMVTTGLHDLVSGSLVKAPSGWWVAKKSVPAQVVVGGVTKYNVPQNPATGTPSGSPLAGDMDPSTVLWLPFPPVGGCV